MEKNNVLLLTTDYRNLNTSLKQKFNKLLHHVMPIQARNSLFNQTGLAVKLTTGLPQTQKSTSTSCLC